MALTLWTLALAVLAALGWWGRRRWQSSARRAELAAARAKASALNAERDRIECRELETLLREGKTSRPAPADRPAARPRASPTCSR
jgi:hypothetical protein